MHQHIPIISQMVRRDVAKRYRGSVLGVLWSLITPLLMLGVYTFVFGTVFKARAWAVPGQDLGTVSFALILFSGLIPFTLFSDMVGKAPRLVVGNRNYVKKVVFPLEILPVVSMGAALVQLAVSFGVLLVFLLISNGGLHWTVVLLPIVLGPFLIIVLGFCWLLASLGVFIRDINQVLPPLLSGTMFLSAIFYPLSTLPPTAQLILLFGNPIVFPVEQVRHVLIYGTQPDWFGLFIYSVVATGVAWLGFTFFQRTRKGFADVL